MRLLRAMGKYLLTAARGEDIVCRYGGEEFVLAMSQAPHDSVLNRAENLRKGVQELGIEYEGRLVGPITVSVGIGVFPDHGTACRLSCALRTPPCTRRSNWDATEW